jgi:hypothetical protein
MQTAGFQTFGGPHLAAMAWTLALPALLAWVARRAASTTVAAALIFRNRKTFEIAYFWGVLSLAGRRSRGRVRK